MGKIKSASTITALNRGNEDAILYDNNDDYYMRDSVSSLNSVKSRCLYRKTYTKSAKAWQKLPSYKKRIYFRKVEKLNLGMTAFDLFKAGL